MKRSCFGDRPDSCGAHGARSRILAKVCGESVSSAWSRSLPISTHYDELRCTCDTKSSNRRFSNSRNGIFLMGKGRFYVTGLRTTTTGLSVFRPFYELTRHATNHGLLKTTKTFPARSFRRVYQVPGTTPGRYQVQQYQVYAVRRITIPFAFRQECRALFRIYERIQGTRYNTTSSSTIIIITCVVRATSDRWRNLSADNRTSWIYQVYPVVHCSPLSSSFQEDAGSSKC